MTTRTPSRFRPVRTLPCLALAAGLIAAAGTMPACSVIDDIRGDDDASSTSRPTSRAQTSARSSKSTSRTARSAPAVQVEEGVAASMIRNGSPWAWVATMQSGVRAISGTAVQNRVTGERMLVGPEQTGQSSVKRQPSWFVTERDRADEVFRVRLERRVETWAEPEVFWFEVLGPLPAQMAISTPVREDGAVVPKLVGSNPPSPIAAVPKSRYPREDR